LVEVYKKVILRKGKFCGIIVVARYQEGVPLSLSVCHHNNDG